MKFVRYFTFSQNETEHKDFPVCGITLNSAGPMKKGKDDENRTRVFHMLGITPDSIVTLSQVHSRVVRIAAIEGAFDDEAEGDGIITQNTELTPCVTVADCMPIYLFDPVTRCFGVLHSGWRGTGIIRSAFDLAFDEWGALPSDFRVILGPHIRSCCYTVDLERADYFIRAFGPSCVVLDQDRSDQGSKWPYRLSMAEANRLLCVSLGVLPGNIVDTNECTSCNAEFGSHRREGPGVFTQMAAFIHCH